MLPATSNKLPVPLKTYTTFQLLGSRDSLCFDLPSRIQTTSLPAPPPQNNHNNTPTHTFQLLGHASLCLTLPPSEQAARPR